MNKLKLTNLNGTEVVDSRQVADTSLHTFPYYRGNGGDNALQPTYRKR